MSGALPRERYFDLVRAAGLGTAEVLRDVDYLASLLESVPDDVRALEQRTGVKKEEVLGIVRSVTFRAVKPAR